jgi:hypothetical protein
MTAQPDHVPSITTRAASAPRTARPATAPAGVPALLNPVPCPGHPAGTTVPGVLAVLTMDVGDRRHGPMILN